MFTVTACGGQSSGESQEAGAEQTEPVTITFSTINMPLRYTAIENAAAAIEERTGDNVKIDIIAGGVMGGSDKEVAEAVFTGSLGMTFAADPMIGVATNTIGWTSLPGFIASTEEADQYYLDSSSEVYQEVDKELAEVGLVRLGVADNGFRVCEVSSAKSYTSLDDAKNLKIRVADDIGYDLYQALGFIPVNMAGSEVLTGLTQGTIDGVDNSIGATFAMGVQDNIKDILQLNAVYGGASVIVNQDVWNTISEENQAIVREEIQKAMVEYTAAFRASETDSLKQYTEAGTWNVIVPDEATQEKIKEASLQILEKYGSQYNADAVAIVQKRIESH